MGVNYFITVIIINILLLIFLTTKIIRTQISMIQAHGYSIISVNIINMSLYVNDQFIRIHDYVTTDYGKIYHTRSDRLFTSLKQ